MTIILTLYWNSQCYIKTALRGKFIDLNVILKKIKINQFSIYLRKLKKNKSHYNKQEKPIKEEKEEPAK